MLFDQQQQKKERKKTREPPGALKAENMISMVSLERGGSEKKKRQRAFYQAVHGRRTGGG